MKKIANDQYFITYPWMMKQLNLKGTTKDIFAIIYGFSISKNKNTDKLGFYGTEEFLADFLNTTQTTVSTALNKLVKSELLVKTTVYEAGFIKKYQYIANIKKLQKLGCINTD